MAAAARAAPQLSLYRFRRKYWRDTTLSTLALKTLLNSLSNRMAVSLSPV
jgi:hypothetical protein